MSCEFPYHDKMYYEKKNGRINAQNNQWKHLTRSNQRLLLNYSVASFPMYTHYEAGLKMLYMWLNNPQSRDSAVTEHVSKNKLLN